MPDTLLASRIESTEVAFEDDGLKGDPVPINQRYPVTLHWERRARARPEAGGKPVNAWRQAVDGALAAFQGGWRRRRGVAGCRRRRWRAARGGCHGPAVGGQGNRRLPRDRATPPPRERGTPDDIIGCLREGVPCFFWLARPPQGDAVARKALCDAFAALKASEAPVEFFQQLVKTADAADPVAAVRLVWDEPGHLPSAQVFEGPSSGESS